MTATYSRPDAPQIIGARILALIAQGMTTQQALDAVCGAGTYATLAGDVYDALNAGK